MNSEGWLGEMRTTPCADRRDMHAEIADHGDGAGKVSPSSVGAEARVAESNAAVPAATHTASTSEVNRFGVRVALADYGQAAEDIVKYSVSTLVGEVTCSHGRGVPWMGCRWVRQTASTQTQMPHTRRTRGSTQHPQFLPDLQIVGPEAAASVRAVEVEELDGALRSVQRKEGDSILARLQVWGEQAGKSAAA